MLTVMKGTPGSGMSYKPLRFYLGHCGCCGAVVRSARLIDTDNCLECLSWANRIALGPISGWDAATYSRFVSGGRTATILSSGGAL